MECYITEFDCHCLIFCRISPEQLQASMRVHYFIKSCLAFRECQIAGIKIATLLEFSQHQDIVGNFPYCTWVCQKIPKRHNFWLFDSSSSLVNFNLDFLLGPHCGYIATNKKVTMNGRPGVSQWEPLWKKRILVRCDWSEILNQRAPGKDFQLDFFVKLIGSFMQTNTKRWWALGFFWGKECKELA